MVMVSRFSRVRPGHAKAWLLSPLLVGALAAHAQAPCIGSMQFPNATLPTPILAGQTCTYTIPANEYPYSYTGSITVPSVNVPGTTTYIASPSTPGENYFELSAFSAMRSPQFSLTSFPVFQADGGSPRSLIGQYSFQLSGKTNAGGQAESGIVAAAGSFTADGKGNITAGVIDINSPAGIVAGEAITGTYQINAFGVGEVSLHTSQGTLQLTVASAPLNASVTQYEEGEGNFMFHVSFPVVSGGTIATTAGGLASASGTFVQALIPAIAAEDYDPYGFQLPGAQLTQPTTLNANFFASLAGQQSGGTSLGGAARFQFATVGTVTADVTIAANGTLVGLPGWTGTYTPFDATTGRSVLTLTDPAQPNVPPQVFTAYETNQGGTLYLVSTAPGQVVGLLSGRADQQ